MADIDIFKKELIKLIDDAKKQEDERASVKDYIGSYLYKTKYDTLIEVWQLSRMLDE